MALLFPGTTHPDLAKTICKKHNMKLGACTIKKFSANETYVKLLEKVRGERCYILQTITENPNDDFMEIFLLADALRRHDAMEVNLIVPYLGYTRQDRRAVMGEPISSQLIANLLVASGIERAITFDLHSDQIEGFFSVPVDNLHCYELFAEYFKKQRLKDPIIVAPDGGAAKIAERLAALLEAPIAIMHKNRPEHHKINHTHIVGDVKDKTAIVFDDMIDTGGSMCQAGEMVMKHGAREVFAAATHAVLSGNAYELLKKSVFTEIVFTDTIPLEKELKNIEVLSVQPLLKKVL